MRLTLDTSVLVDALRRDDKLEELLLFFSRALPFLRLSSVVVTELEAGAHTPAAREKLERSVLSAFEPKGRIVAPTVSQWRRAGHLLSESADDPGSVRRQNDTLIAIQARDSGWILVTRDLDFIDLKRRVRGLKVVAPFPSPMSWTPPLRPPRQPRRRPLRGA